MRPPTLPHTNESSEDVTKLIVDIFDGDYASGEASKEKLSVHPNREAAIPITMSRFRKLSMDDAKHRGEIWEISGVLGAVGTIAAVDPLLEIYEAVPKGRLDEHGDVLEEDKYDSEGQQYDTGFEPSHFLVRLDGGIEELRKKCNADDYENILVRGQGESTAYYRALAEIGGERASNRILHTLRQRDWEEEKRFPAIEALTSVGAQAIPTLLVGLEYGFWYSRSQETDFRLDLLNVLALVGDKTCVDKIMEAAQRDSSIAKQALDVIDAIASRDKSIVLPEHVATGPIQIPQLEPTGDPYVDSCFRIEFGELDDPRDFHDLDQFEQVSALNKERRFSEALSIIDSAWMEHGDFDLVYAWKASIFRGMGDFDSAREVLMEGLKKAKAKYSLCDELGVTEFEAGTLRSAVKWWVRSCAAQLTIKKINSSTSFLYLAYIAKALGDDSQYSVLMNEIPHGPIELNAEGQQLVISRVQSDGEEPILRAIQTLSQNFIS